MERLTKIEIVLGMIIVILFILGIYLSFPIWEFILNKLGMVNIPIR